MIGPSLTMLMEVEVEVLEVVMLIFGEVLLVVAVVEALVLSEYFINKEVLYGL